MRRARRSFTLTALLGAAVPGAAHAQDALRGKRLYLDAARVVGSGVSCVDCHGGLPGGLFGIGRAANDPARIAQAIDSVPPMAPFRGRFEDGDRADLAAYLGDPLVPSPQVTVTAVRGDGSEARAERVDFGTVRPGTSAEEVTVVLANSGQLPFTLARAPQLLDDSTGAFALTSTDCAAGQPLEPTQACRVALRFSPTGADGPRAARLRIGHDWVGGAAAVALSGRVGAPAPPLDPSDPEEPDAPRDSPGCQAVSGREARNQLGWLLAALGLPLLGRRQRRVRPS